MSLLVICAFVALTINAYKAGKRTGSQGGFRAGWRRGRGSGK